MKSKTKRILAFLCAVILFVTTVFTENAMRQAEAEDSSTAKTTSTEPVPVELYGFENVTLNGLVGATDNSVMTDKEYVSGESQYRLKNNIDFDKKLFTAWVKFTDPDTENNWKNRICIGGTAGNGWGLSVSLSNDGKSLLVWDADGTKVANPQIYKPIEGSDVKVDSFLGETFLLQMGYEYLDYDNDGNKNDVRILVYVNGNEGINTVVKDCNMTTLGNYVIVSILNDSKIQIKSADLPLKPVKLEGFKNITISDFKDSTGAQMPTGTYSHGVGHNLFGWNDADDFNKVIFSMKVTFGPVDKGYNNAIHFGGPYDDWNVMCLYPTSADCLQIDDPHAPALTTGSMDPIVMNAKDAGVSSFVDDEFCLELSFEYYDADSDGGTDLKLGVYIDGMLYGGQPFTIKDINPAHKGTWLRWYSESSANVITLDDFKATAEPIRLSGFDTITVCDFQDVSGTEMESKAYAYDATTPDATFTLKNTSDNFANKLLSMKVKFGYVSPGAENYDTRMVIGADGVYSGIFVYVNSDDQLCIDNKVTNAKDERITVSEAGVSSFLNTPFILQMSFADISDGLVVGVFINGALCKTFEWSGVATSQYNNQIHLRRNLEDSFITVNSIYEDEFPKDPETPPEQPNENFEKITFHDFGVDSGKYKYNRDIVVEGSTSGTLNKTVFSGDVLLSGSKGFQIMYGGKANTWDGLRIALQDDGNMNLLWTKIGVSDLFIKQITPANVGMTEFVNHTFNLTISMELVDENKNGTDDIKIGVWLDKVLYKNEYMIIYDRGDELGNRFGVYCGMEGTSVTLGSVPELPKQSFDKITFSHFGVSNGAYEYNGDVVVEGSTSGTLNKTVFSGDVLLSGSKGFQIMYGGKANTWDGLRIALQDDGNMNLLWTKIGVSDLFIKQITPANVGMTEFVNHTFNLTISMELVDENENGTDDIKIGVWLDKVLYKNEYMIIYDRGDELGNRFGVYCGMGGTSATLGSIPELTTQPDEAYEKVTFSQFGIKDDTYKYLGDRDSVVVKGSIAGTEGVDKKVVCGKVLFEGSGEFQLLLGGTHAWDGLHLYVNADYSATTMILLGLDSQEVTSFDAGKAGLTSFVGGDGFELMWSVEEVGTDLKVGVWFNGFLYGNEYITISNCNPDLGNIFAVACSADGASVTLGSMPELTKLPEHSLNKVTFSDFGIESGTYEGSKEVAGNADKYTTLDGAVFSGDFFVSEGKQFYVLYGGKDGSYWNSLSFMIQDGGEMNVAWYTNGTATDLIQILPENTAAGTFLNKTFNLMISTELVDNDGNGVDDIKVRIWFDKILYKHNGGEYHIISDMGDALGNGLGMYCGSGVTVSIREDAEYQEDIYYYDDISPYRTTGAYEGPVKEGLVFSGWYEDKDYTKPIGQDVTQGGAYAKFVEGDVLSVKPQVKVTNTGELPMDKTDLRFATTVDSLEYRRVSFFIQTQKGDGQNYGAETDTGINENPENPREVYRQLYYMNNTKISKYVPSVFSWMSNFFKTVTLTNIPYANYGTMIKVTPYWITLDGTTVRGTALEICVNQYEPTTTEGLYKVTTEFLGENTMPIAGYHGPYQYNGADNNGLFPNYVTDEYFKMIADAGVNLVVHSATDYAEYPSLVMKQLELGEKYGIGMYVNDSNICNLTSTDAIKTYIQNAKYFNSKAFCGMFVADEPGGTDNVSGERNIADIGDELSALKSLGLLDYTNMYPIQNYITSGLLETWFTPNAINDKDKNIYNTYVNTVSKLDTSVLSWDYYPFEEKRLTTNGTYDMNLYFWNLNLIREKAIANNKPFWAHIQAGSQFNNEGEDFPSTTPYYPSESQFNWNVNTNLAFGAKGIQYFPLIQPDGFAYVDSSTWDFERNGLIGTYGNKTQWYYYAQEINKHIATIDEVLMNSVNKGVVVSGTAQSDTNNLNTDGATSTCIMSSYNDLTSISGNAMVGCFDYNGKMALYVVNYNMCDQNASQDAINNAKQTITLEFKKDYSNMKMIQNATSSVQTTNNKKLNLTLEAGEGVLLVIE